MEDRNQKFSAGEHDDEGGMKMVMRKRMLKWFPLPFLSCSMSSILRALFICILFLFSWNNDDNSVGFMSSFLILIHLNENTILPQSMRCFSFIGRCFVDFGLLLWDCFHVVNLEHYIHTFFSLIIQVTVFPGYLLSYLMSGCLESLKRLTKRGVIAWGTKQKERYQGLIPSSFKTWVSSMSHGWKGWITRRAQLKFLWFIMRCWRDVWTILVKQ